MDALKEVIEKNPQTKSKIVLLSPESPKMTQEALRLIQSFSAEIKNVERVKDNPAIFTGNKISARGLRSHLSLEIQAPLTILLMDKEKLIDFGPEDEINGFLRLFIMELGGKLRVSDQMEKKINELKLIGSQL